MKKIITILLVLFSSYTFADQKDVPGAWFGLFHKGDLGNDYFMWGEVQLRYTMEEGEMQQTLFRFGPLKKLNENHEVGLLYGFMESSVKEYRTTLQHSQRYLKTETAELSGRSRLEYRNIEDNDDDAVRFRYLLRYQQNLKERLDLVLWDEPFLNLTSDKWTGERTVERNRAFAGVRLPFAKMNIETGYLNQYVPRHDKSVMEHLAVLYIFY